MASATTDTKMTYRFLGDSGLLVSKLSLGSWMDVNDKYTAEAWYDMMKLAFEHGINFFDNAEAYGSGLAERNMGAAIKKGIAEGTWSREDLVITTKIFFGSKGFLVDTTPNENGLSRKHIIEGTKASLKRLEQDYVDVIFCHRPEPFTPIEETVRAMNFVINQGWAFYWGTSQWSAAQIIEACEIADRLGLIRPIVEQPVYNILERNKVDFEYVDLYKKYKLGLTVWSPLAFGILTGKYSTGKPGDSRLADAFFKDAVPDFDERVVNADKLKPVAEKLGISMVELALAWCVSNENVSTVMIGAKTLTQLEQNLKAIEALGKITPEIKAEIDQLVPFAPELPGPDPLSLIRAKHL
ncbi:putative voltage-gated potassium channel subunit beta [Phytophthora citrophthora]|uniref:Voltage-gated potassium channel subunit beta n=1 Tax=Phytophthora citrophthora TaxID=4793 RepID=A0AAD9GBE8_9STRA|nr:putative voltage-gated potassium channel subunit beta [Phytophthora citrophthora]